MKKLKGVCIGAGYFGHFQYEAWNRIPEVEITACCDLDAEKRATISKQYGIKNSYEDWREMLDKEQPDFVDIITPPATHLEMSTEAAKRGIHIVCQKPLAGSFERAKELVEKCSKVRLMIHENFRYQPWHREIKRQIEAGAIGKPFSLYMRSRMGDGWGDTPYTPRQPYFRNYPRLLIYETGIHFIDTFRYLMGEIEEVDCWLRQLNSAIKAEDCGLMIIRHTNGCMSVWDANRYNEPPTGTKARYTFGEMLVEGSKGSLRLKTDGSIEYQALGEPSVTLDYEHHDRGFAGDCAYNCQRHFVDCMLDGSEFETSGQDYLKNMEAQQAIYEAAEKHGWQIPSE
ncbi:MAG: Gfo/Idh/MocA family protein [Lentimonas sp.]